MFKQIEILLEGWNPDADAPLTDGERVRVRAVLRTDEAPRAIVRGRVLRAGAALWVGTDAHVVVLRSHRRQGHSALAWSQVQDVVLQRGRYGIALALNAANTRHTMFAADPDMARAFAALHAASQGRSAAPAAAQPAVLA